MELYKKYRPNDFNEVFGNEIIIENLDLLLERDIEDIPHTIMFYGPYGTGKTTMARIFAKKLGASKEDTYEIDVGSNRSVDDADSLKKKVRFKPSNGKVKVYIIDEIQIAVRGSYQESLLKTLEDGAPKFVFFIVCTTDPHKVNLGAKSRSTKFELKKLTTREMTSLLKSILKKEDKEISLSVIKEIAVKSDGVSRDALVMLDQVIDMSDEKKMIEIVESYSTEEDNVLDLCRALLGKKKWEVVVEILNKIKQDPEKVRLAILGYMEKVLRNPKSNKNDMIIASGIIIEFEKQFYYGESSLLTNSCYLCANG